MKKEKRMEKIVRLNRNVLFSIIVVSLFVSLAYASTFIDNSQSGFNSGTYNWTFYNSSGFVQLNSSRLNGTYTSQIFNAGSSSRWNNISWTQGGYYQQELPNNQVVETSFGSGNANMTGNVLLMHFNNDTGENATFFKDWSGMNNNGTCSGTTCPNFNSSGSGK